MATVIRAGEPATRIIKQLSSIDLSDHLISAESMAARARAQAHEILEQAKHQRSQILSRAREDGYEQGLAEGRAAGHAEGFRAGQEMGHTTAREESVQKFAAEQANLVSSLRQVISDLDRLKDETGIKAAQNVLDFAIRVASKLTFAIGKLHPKSAQANLQRALELVGQKTGLLVRMNPADMDAARAFLDEGATAMQNSAAVRFAGDDSLAPGGCRVETESGEIDASLETQIDEIIALLLGETR